jgi:hypothetical protein
MAYDMPGSDAPLTGDTFAAAYQAVAWNIYLETPLNPAFGFSAPELQRSAVAEHTRALDRWRDYALDGNPDLLNSHDGTTPWRYLRTTRTALGDAVGTLDSAHDNIIEAWTGVAASKYAEYMVQMRDRIKSHVGENAKEGYLADVADLLEAAYAAQVAFKKDLLELARAANDALKGLDDGSPWKTIGLICLALGGLALGSMVGPAAVVSTVFVTKLGEEIIGKVGEYAFGHAEKELQVGGNTVAEIMATLDGGLNQVIGGYQSIARQLTAKMDAVLVELRSASTVGEDYPQVPAVDVKRSLREFLPESAQGNPRINEMIDHG